MAVYEIVYLQEMEQLASGRQQALRSLGTEPTFVKPHQTVSPMFTTNVRHRPNFLLKQPPWNNLGRLLASLQVRERSLMKIQEEEEMTRYHRNSMPAAKTSRTCFQLRPFSKRRVSSSKTAIIIMKLLKAIIKLFWKTWKITCQIYETSWRRRNRKQMYKMTNIASSNFWSKLKLMKRSQNCWASTPNFLIKFSIICLWVIIYLSFFNSYIYIMIS